MAQTPVSTLQRKELIPTGYVSLDCCGKKGVKRPRPRSVHIYCEECSARREYHVFLCNNAFDKGKNALCHAIYHNNFHFITAEEAKEEENNSMSED